VVECADANDTTGDAIAWDDPTTVSVFAKYHVEREIHVDKMHMDTKGAIGCFLSHVKAWRRIVSEGENCYIIEDDVNLGEMCMCEKLVKVNECVEKMKSDFGFISIMHLNYFNDWLGIPWMKHCLYLKEDIIDDKWLMINNRNFIGTQMYYLTVDGAKTLLKHCFPLICPVDVYVSYMCASKTDGMRGVMLKNSLYSIREATLSQTSSSIHHFVSIKRFLPEKNTTYCLILLILLLFIYSAMLAFKF
jgi:GR25 family glycosyltransferase involved in LPS biosynthesis